VPAGTQVIEFPTTAGTIVGRWACDGPADLGAVQALQNGLSLEPHGRPPPLQGIPAPAAVPAGLAFFEQMRTWLQAFPPSGSDQAYQKRFTPLGLLDPVSPCADCPPDLARALAAGADAAKQQMGTLLKDGDLAPVVNGWRLTFHMFDYNLDHLGRAPSTTPCGRWPTARRATWPGPWRPAAACGVTTATRLRTR
jgi:hypothetical protein